MLPKDEFFPRLIAFSVIGGVIVAAIILAAMGLYSVYSSLERQPLEAEVLTEPLLVRVDYFQSLEEMIKCGRYDSATRDILDYRSPYFFEGDRHGFSDGEKVNICLVSFDRSVTCEEVSTEFQKLNFRFANVAEFLALGSQYPEEQRKHPIVVLGTPHPSVYVHPAYIARLGCDDFDGGRILSYSTDIGWGDKFGGDYYFAAVRE